jgi:hypothetical protein
MLPAANTVDNSDGDASRGRRCVRAVATARPAQPANAHGLLNRAAAGGYLVSNEGGSKDGCPEARNGEAQPNGQGNPEFSP